MTEKEMELAVTNYMHWYGVATFLRCPLVTDFKDVDIGLVGVPYSGGNAIERMQYLGPRAVRNRSSSYRRAHRQFGIDPFKLARVADLGDAPVGRMLNPDMAAEDFQAYFEQVFAANNQAGEHWRRPFHYLADPAGQIAAMTSAAMMLDMVSLIADRHFSN